MVSHIRATVVMMAVLSLQHLGEASSQDTSTVETTTTSGRPLACDCGKNRFQDTGRIVGGVEVQVHEWPWQVALRFTSGFQFCGGSLISPNWVLTAAHCVVHYTVYQIFVSIGEHKIYSGSDTNLTVHRTISQKIVHSGYDAQTVTNDIAVIKMSSPVAYSHGIRPVCLPTNLHKHFAGENATVTGWGATAYKGSPSYVLLEVTLPVITNKKCAKMYGWSIGDGQVCTYEEGKDACQGDSGGPLVWLDGKGYYHQIGIVSYGVGCASKNRPGVYTRVTSYINWIQETTNASFCNT